MADSDREHEGSLTGDKPNRKDLRTPRVLVLAAPGSGSGKTLVSLGLIAALRQAGTRVVAAKTGPDYIDTAFLGRAAGTMAVNLDPWSMDRHRLARIATGAASGHDLLLVEGVMGLFDGAMSGRGSTADLAVALRAPVVLVVDAARQSQSIAPLVAGFANWRPEVHIGGLILNNVGSARHDTLLKNALAPLGIPVLAAIPRRPELVVPSRHLGLTLPGEVDGIDRLLTDLASLIGQKCDLDALLALASPLAPPSRENAPESEVPDLAPLGQHMAIARDAAFAFIYRHWLDGWRAAGASLSFFSPLADEPPDPSADAVFLPGGYPELHGPALAGAATFHRGLVRARDRGALIYGECGGYMVLGQSLTDREGMTYPMAGLLPHSTRIDRPRRTLGYRFLRHESPLPWPRHLSAHEFHYSTTTEHDLPPLFQATTATGEACAPMGGFSGRVVGSYAHVIDPASPSQVAALPESGPARGAKP